MTELTHETRGVSRGWGVTHVWLADPYSERLHVMGADGLQEVPAFKLPEYDLHITKEDLF